ncbi:hypothetical protein LTR94_031548, partial [Friedmanniomyces endolithicus]
MARRNLTVVTNARTTRIVVERGRAVAVEYLRGRTPERVAVAGEAILCAGAVQSPHLLQLSGIGDPQRLRDAGHDRIDAAIGAGPALVGAQRM